MKPDVFFNQVDNIIIAKIGCLVNSEIRIKILKICCFTVTDRNHVFL